MYALTRVLYLRYLRRKLCIPSGNRPLMSAGEPRDDHDEEDGDRPQRQPDEVRDRQQQAEEHGEARALEIVRDDQPDGMVGARLQRGSRRDLRLRGRWLGGKFAHRAILTSR